MGKPKSPKSPDYLALAKEGGEQERQTALWNLGLNRPTQLGPTGQTTWTLRPGADPSNPQPGDYIQSTTLSPNQQALLEGQERLGLGQQGLVAGAGGLAGQAAQGIDFGPLNTSGLPGLTSGPTPTGSPYSSVTPQALQRSLPGGLPGLGTNLPGLDSSYEGSRGRVEQALLDRMEPSLAQGEEAERVRLLNAGIERGSEGWNREMDRLARTRQDSLTSAILAGGQEQSRLADMERAARGQLYGEQLSSRGQLFGEQLQGGQFGNQAAMQAFQQALASGQFGNQAAQQAFEQSLASGEADRAAREQGFGELVYGQQAPIDQYLSLLQGGLASGGQGAGLPQYPGYLGASGATASDPLSAAAMQQQGALGRYQTQQQGYNNVLSSAATAAALYF